MELDKDLDVEMNISTCGVDLILKAMYPENSNKAKIEMSLEPKKKYTTTKSISFKKWFKNKFFN